MIHRLLAILALAVALPAQSPLHLADLAYDEHRFAEARRHYIEAVAGGSASIDTESWFRAGNAAYRVGRYAEAAWLYRSALEQAPREERLRANLRLAEQRLGCAKTTTPTLGQAVFTWFERRSDPELAWCLFGLLAISSFGCFSSRMRFGPRSTSALVVASSLFGLVALGLRSAETEPRSGVILETHAEVVPAPHASLEPEATLAPGEHVRVLAFSDRWVHVRSTQTEGWVRRSRIGLIP